MQNYPNDLFDETRDLASDGAWGAQATALVDDGDDLELVHVLALVPVVQLDMSM